MSATNEGPAGDEVEADTSQESLWDRGLGAAFSRAEEASPPVPESLGPYRIRGLLGEGGMGIVYDAEEEFPARRVALKVIKPGLATGKLLRRFELEAQLLGRMQHPGIARIHRAGVFESPHGPQPYLAMERVEGLPLDAWIEQHAPTTRERVELIAKIADALQHAHQKGVIHRDLKPSNVLVDEQGEARVVDFGVALAEDSHGLTTMHTAAGQIIGTLGYMAPEQLSGAVDEVDSRCDVYALGALLYEALSGELPIAVTGKNLPSAIRDILEVEPLPLGRVSAGLNGDLATIAQLALEKDPEQRYPTAAAFAEDLRRSLRNEPILARPVTSLYRFQKLARRQPLALGFGVALILALFAGVIGTSLYAWRAEEARTLAENERDLKDRINGILTDILASASPFGRGLDTKVLDVLQETETRLEHELSDDPGVESALRLTLAKAYRELGAYELGLGSARRAEELFSADKDAVDLMIIRARAEVIRNSTGLYHMDGLRSEVEELAALASATLGAEHRDTLRIRGDRMTIYMMEGRGDLILEDARRLVEDRQRILGEDDGDVAFAMQLLSSAYSQAGKLVEAVRWMREAAELMNSIEGSDSARTLKIRLELASLLSNLGEFEEAQALITELVAKSVETFGEDHWATAELLTVQGQELAFSRDYEAAEPILRRACQLVEQHLGPRHDVTLNRWSDLGICLREAGRLDEALEILEDVLEVRLEVDGSDGYATGGAWMAVGVTHRRAGRFEDALVCYRECEAIDEANIASDHGDALWTQRNIAVLLLDMGRPAEAIPILERILPLRQRDLGRENRHACADLVYLAQALAADGQHERALERYEERLAIEGHDRDEQRVRAEVRAAMERSRAALEGGE